MLKLSDLGLAKTKRPASSTAEEPLYESNVGTAMYHAPERLKEQQYTFQAEVFAAGVILFQMIFGKHPYEGCKTRRAVVEAQERLVFPAVPSVSPACVDLIQKMLHLDPSLRISVDEVAKHQWLSENLSSPAPAVAMRFSADASTSPLIQPTQAVSPSPPAQHFIDPMITHRVDTQQPKPRTSSQGPSCIEGSTILSPHDDGDGRRFHRAKARTACL